MKGASEDDGDFMSAMGVTDEEKRQAKRGVMTNVATFAAIVFALRVGKVYFKRHKTECGDVRH